MLISVVMSVFNGEDYLIEAVESILTQSYKNIEFIIVNDGSTDGTQDLLDSIKDNRVQIIHQKENRGTPIGLNLAISMSKGNWIAIQDADDISMPTRIEHQVNFIKQNTDVRIVSSLVECIPGKQKIPLRQLINMASGFNYSQSHQEIMDNRYLGCPFCHGSVMYSKALFYEVGGYDPDYRICQDYDLWLRMLNKDRAYKLPKCLYQYRVHHGSISQRNNLTMYIQIWKLITSDIIRQFVKKGINHPTFIIIGSKENCKKYEEHVVMDSQFQIVDYLYDPKPVELNSNQVDAIIFLDTNRYNRMFNQLIQNGWTKNQNLFKVWTDL
ncbi:glycosyltransferase family 2 protein [Pseudalkalibacillus berkeleyi]|uniref:Glycosyltransferase n=1 Tax=Pseudalkalibacillus berkeleyi TaxID=1069813 RepID=A0ABS9H143_9BACL|nr:glycosyltransferase [Pseudalkalibacillus berkeleyi]MCF6138717.1 glycosyltransferase [Pseudalkalibacillus berkeleyi]